MRRCTTGWQADEEPGSNIYEMIRAKKEGFEKRALPFYDLCGQDRKCRGARSRRLQPVASPYKSKANGVGTGVDGDSGADLEDGKGLLGAEFLL